MKKLNKPRGKKLSLRGKKTKYIITALLVLCVISGAVVFYRSLIARSAVYGWVQTNWSGGADTGATAAHPGDETGWTKYYSKDEVVSTSTPGEIKLASTTVSWTETANADFNAGTLDNTFASSSAVWLKKPTGVACSYGAECTGGYCNASNICDVCENFIYSSQTYAVVMIGEQCWMAENLNVGLRIDTCDNGPCTPGVDCDNSCATRGGSVNNQGVSCVSIEKYCYNDATSTYCDAEGGLYQWDQMMCGSTVAGAQGICPNGWHLPTDGEWKTLEGAVDSTYGIGNSEWDGTGWRGSDAGTKLKSGGSSGFAALLAGNRDYGGYFSNRGSCAFFWSSSESGGYAWDRRLDSGYSTVRRDALNKVYGVSVRCLKD